MYIHIHTAVGMYHSHRDVTAAVLEDNIISILHVDV